MYCGGFSRRHRLEPPHPSAWQGEGVDIHGRSCFCCDGSMPSATSLRASSRLVRAVASETSGNAPARKNVEAAWIGERQRIVADAGAAVKCLRIARMKSATT